MERKNEQGQCLCNGCGLALTGPTSRATGQSGPFGEVLEAHNLYLDEDLDEFRYCLPCSERVERFGIDALELSAAYLPATRYHLFTQPKARK